MTERSKINIHLGDCMEAMKEMPDNAYDLAIVDPPYGLERFKNVTTTPSSKDVHAKRFQRMETVNNDKPTDEYWSELFRVSKNQIVWGANNFEMPPSEYFLFWNKKQTVDNFASAEYAWVSPGLKKPAKVFDYGIHKHNSSINRIHPTQKPVKLYEWLLINYAKPGDKILDTHGGSMSIAIACWNMKFDLDLWEIDKEYYEAGKQRLEQHQAQLQIF